MEKYEKFAGNLAAEVCREALQRADMNSSDITHLVTVTCTGFYAPGFDFQIVRGLGLPESVQRTQVGFMGCQAVLNALRIASAFTEADPTARVLICSLELCSLHFQYGWNPDRVVSNALFADGAGAIVGSGDAAETGEGSLWRVKASGSRLLPESHDAMTWRIGDHGFVMTLSPRIPELIQRFLPGWIDEWLIESNLSKDLIASWAVHPGGTRILRAVEKALELPEASTMSSRQVLTEHGNMSSATIIYILERLVAQKAPLPCVALGFGPGLTVEGMLID
jgi:predicted naringenin-chalcone synthase